jgi:hypothetical protein
MMSERLERLRLSKGDVWERLDPLDTIGVSTYALLRDAIAEGRDGLAADLVDYLYYWEIKYVRDANIDLAGGLPQFVMAAHGEDGFYELYRAVMERAVYDPRAKMGRDQPPARRDIDPLDWTLAYAARMVRLHRMGADDGTGGFTVEDYEDRYEILWDPCYTGGRTRRGDTRSGRPPHSAEPYDYAVNTAPHPWSWSHTGVSGYCMHCCILHEIMDVEQTGGYLQQWVTGYSDDPAEPCRYIVYKDVDWIPEAYYTRIGKTKPRVMLGCAPPRDAKLLAVRHSDELGLHWINRATLIKRALAEGRREDALRFVDELDAETGIWHLCYPLTSNWAWMDLIVEMYGYGELQRALMAIPSMMEPPRAAGAAIPCKAGIGSAEQRVRRAALWARSDRGGPDGSSVRVIDEPERIILELAPCGSVGRRQKTIDQPSPVAAAVGKELGTDLYLRYPLTPRTQPPYSAGVTSERHPVAWNKSGIPHLCTRCCAHFELAALARTGYLTTVVERSEDATDTTCRWFFYKDLDDVPEEYYLRLGVRKPAPVA